MAFSFGKMNDPDATLFIQVSEITGSTQRGAIVDLVKDLKSNNLWSKMKAIYPFVGGTAASHKWNLKDPRDLDAAFRLTLYGGWTHSANGMKPNGTTSWADTYCAPATHLTNNSTHLSFYSRTEDSSLGSDIMAVEPNTSNRLLLACKDTPYAVSDHYNYDTNRILPTGNRGDGYYLTSRTSSTVHKLFRNSVQLGSTNTSTSSGFSSLTMNILLGRYAWPNVTDYRYSNRECAFATIGDGLTDADVSNLHTIVQKYQTTLGRQV